MTQKLTFSDIMALGFMLFAFFFGAGNIIFPPLAGQLAGEAVLPAMSGFLLTAVGLPLLAIVAVSLVGGGWNDITQDLPPKMATLIAVVIFIVIGPAFAAPRTGLVAYEMAITPLVKETADWHLMAFSVLFFAIAMAFSWTRGRLIDLIGKLLTPALFIGLFILAAGVILSPQGAALPASGPYASQPFSKGFIEGYNTMDSLAALMFGMLIVDALRNKGITQVSAIKRYLITSAIIAAVGLAIVYVSLFYLGVTSTNIAAGADNGAFILSQYVQVLFGAYGQSVLSGIMILACLTTAIGLISACSDYFSSLTSLSYRTWVVIIGSICALVTNVGLAQLIQLSIPALVALYPVVIALVALTFFRHKMANTQWAFRWVCLVAFAFALLDAAKVMNLNVSFFSFLPLFDDGMSWVLPSLIVGVLTFFVPNSSRKMALS